VEKPTVPPSNLVNMGIYLTSVDFLEQFLSRDQRSAASGHDFGKDILPGLIRDGANIYAYPFDDYWADIGTIESYWLAHMKLLHEPQSIDLSETRWMIHTRAGGRPPSRLVSGSRIIDSLVSEGCIAAKGAVIEHSILSPGVQVLEDAVIRDSILLDGTVVGPGAVVERTIVDKQVTIGNGVKIGGRLFDPHAPISLIGRDIRIPPHITLESGSLIDTHQVFEGIRIDLQRSEKVKPGVSL
jgi:glucose-1-phosphate adenylyltransferase